MSETIVVELDASDVLLYGVDEALRAAFWRAVFGKPVKIEPLRATSGRGEAIRTLPVPPADLRLGACVYHGRTIGRCCAFWEAPSRTGGFLRPALESVLRRPKKRRRG